MVNPPIETPSNGDGAPGPAPERAVSPSGASEGNGQAWDEAELPRIGAPLAPLIDGVARIRASIHRKLLAGFLVGAVLLFAMGVLSLLAIDRMSQEMERLSQLQ